MFYSPCKNRELYVQEFIKWVEGMSPDVFMTLTFTMDVSEAEAQACMKQFILHISRACFSKTKFKKGCRIKIFPFMERTQAGRIHYHVLLKVPPKYSNRIGAFKDRVRKYWMRVRATEKNNFPFCGGNPLLLDKKQAKWFCYEKGGFDLDACKSIVNYLLKELYIKRNGSLDTMCVDAENIRL